MKIIINNVSTMKQIIEERKLPLKIIHFKTDSLHLRYAALPRVSTRATAVNDYISRCISILR